MILRGTAATIRVNVYVDGTLTALTSNGTVTVNDEAGNEIATGAGTTDGTGIVKFSLTPTHTADVNRLTILWEGLQHSGGALFDLTTYEEVVGDLLFTESEARGFGDAGLAAAAVTPVSDAVIQEGLVRIHDAFEEILGYPLGTRYRREEVDGDGTGQLRVAWPYVSAVRSVSYRARAGEDWTALTSDELEEVAMGGHMWPEWQQGTFAKGRRNVRVEYEAGKRIALEVKRAALQVLRDQLVASSIPGRALSIQGQMGSIQMAYANSDANHWFGIPDVDAVLQRNRERMPI